MRLFAGTSGFSYKEWKGTFYPRDLADASMLRYYAERLPAVEINNTFYRMPRAEMLGKWAEAVPENFRFVLKASRRITHQQRLKDAGDSVEYLFKAATALGPKLGPILFQLPPFLKKDVELLSDFLAALPSDCRAAFEFRNASWFDDAVYDALRARNAALVGGDADKAEKSPPLVATADWGYLRLRAPDYSDAALAQWAERIAAEPFEDVYAFFKHEKHGPALAEGLLGRFNPA
jgi:uncharacterized protein YecE (DUF72 family)